MSMREQNPMLNDSTRTLFGQIDQLLRVAMDMWQLERGYEEGEAPEFTEEDELGPPLDKPGDREHWFLSARIGLYHRLVRMIAESEIPDCYDWSHSESLEDFVDRIIVEFNPGRRDE